MPGLSGDKAGIADADEYLATSDSQSGGEPDPTVPATPSVADIPAPTAKTPTDLTHLSNFEPDDVVRDFLAAGADERTAGWSPPDGTVVTDFGTFIDGARLGEIGRAGVEVAQSAPLPPEDSEADERVEADPVENEPNPLEPTRNEELDPALEPQWQYNPAAGYWFKLAGAEAPPPPDPLQSTLDLLAGQPSPIDAAQQAQLASGGQPDDFEQGNLVVGGWVVRAGLSSRWGSWYAPWSEIQNDSFNGLKYAQDLQIPTDTAPDVLNVYEVVQAQPVAAGQARANPQVPGDGGGEQIYIVHPNTALRYVGQVYVGPGVPPF